MVNGRPAYSIWFHVHGTFPLDLAQDLKNFCLAKYTEAAGAVPVEFAKATPGGQNRKRWTGPKSKAD